MTYKKLLACFQVYANHHEECPMMQKRSKAKVACNCGFREAMEEAVKPPPSISALRKATAELDRIYPEGDILKQLRAVLKEELV